MSLKLLKSKKDKLLLGSSKNHIGYYFKHIEPDSLTKRPALAYRRDISLFDSEGRGAVCGDIGVSLFESVVLLYEV